MQKYLFPSTLLLPASDPEKFAVIACDQFTSDAAYWQSVEETVGDAPSSLRLILPEIYLSKDKRAILTSIRTHMEQYLRDGYFTEHPDAMIYVERKLANGAVRRGIVATVDLADYDYHKGADARIRATEETIPERIPPRVAIREQALLELSHILLLADDPADRIIGAVAAVSDSLPLLYDFDLMQGGGHLIGRLIPSALQDEINAVLAEFEKSSPMLFAVGDGNHSLATAKECYNAHPDSFSRYAMVELVNLHDPSLVFEPIYRIVYGMDSTLLRREMESYFGTLHAEDGQTCLILSANGEETLSLPPVQKLTVGSLQSFLNDLTARYPDVKLDYVHEAETVRSRSLQPDTTGFLFDSIHKNELFPAVLADGALPRKTFSMGEGYDKRYYLEAREIRK
ncbi:MAG: DUF1015 domain-containing protein [Clostridia bacterium]|nr:DUF1015 domain-containing protein [Clostridia bacterium]